jgi:hypothetical protein
MSAGIGVFLRLAAPSGGRLHAPGSSWLLAGLVTGGVVLAALAVAFGLRGRRGASRSRRAAVLGSATGISWGFMAAVIKELSSHLGNGIGALVTTWSLYLLLAAGAATMLLARTRWRSPAGRLPAGFTILTRWRPACSGCSCSASTFNRGGRPAAEALALAVVIAAATLSRSCLILGEDQHPACLDQPTLSRAADTPSQSPRADPRHGRRHGVPFSRRPVPARRPGPRIPGPGIIFRPACPVTTAPAARSARG